MYTFEAILKILSSSEMTSFEIATELGLAPAKMTALLAKLVSRQEVKKVGKIRSNGKDVTIYASTDLVTRKAHASAQSDLVNSNFEIVSKLHQTWGGYISVNSNPSKRRSTLRHKIE